MPRFVTLDALPTPHDMQARPGEPLYFGSPVPPELDLQRIAVDTIALQGRLRWGGMENAVTYPTISRPAGFSPSGEESTAHYNLHYSSDDRRRVPDRRWPTIGVMLGTDDLRLADETSPRQPKERVWAHATNIALRQSMAAGARDILWGDERDYPARLVSYGIYVVDALTGALILSESPVAGLALSIMLGQGAIMRGMGAMQNRERTGSYELSRARWDLAGMDGISPDRYAFARARMALPGPLHVKK